MTVRHSVFWFVSFRIDSRPFYIRPIIRRGRYLLFHAVSISRKLYTALKLIPHLNAITLTDHQDSAVFLIWHEGREWTRIVTIFKKRTTKQFERTHQNIFVLIFYYILYKWQSWFGIFFCCCFKKEVCHYLTVIFQTGVIVGLLYWICLSFTVQRAIHLLAYSTRKW